MISDDQGLSEPPPHWVREEAKDLWRRLAPTLIRRGHLTPLYRGTFEAFILAVANYLMFSRALRAVKYASPKADASEVEAQLVELRTAARRWASEFLLLPPARERLALVDAVGEDVELKRLFGLDEV